MRDKTEVIDIRKQSEGVCLLMVYMRIQLHLDLQVDMSSVVVKGPFFPQVWTQDGVYVM
jgi:hypothetical protein